MNHFIISAFLGFMSTLSVGIYFVLRSRSVDRFFGLFWLSVAFWTCFVAMQFQLLNWMTGDAWGWLLHLGCISVPVLFCHFVSHAAHHGQGHSWLLKAAYLVAAIFIFLNTFTHLFTQEIVYREHYLYPKPAVLYPLYILFFQIMGLWSISLILKWARQWPVKSRKIVYFFLIFHILAYIGSMDNFLIMYDVRIFPLYPYGLYLIVPYAFFGSYAVSRLPMLDADRLKI